MLGGSRTAHLLSLLIAVSGRTLDAGTVEIQCTADTTLHEFFPESNLGACNEFYSGSTAHVLSAGPSRTRGLIAFALGGKIPVGASITRVQVQVQPTESRSVPETYGLHRMLTSWGEGTGFGRKGKTALDGEASWIWRAKPTLWGAAGGEPGVDFLSEPSASMEIREDGVYAFSSPGLISDVHAWIADPAKNFGWMLISASEEKLQMAKRFGSRENGLGVGPVLVLDFVEGSGGLRFNTPQRKGTSLVLSWAGGKAPYQLQSTTNLANRQWVDVLPATSNTTAQVELTFPMEFFRVSAAP